MFVYLHKKDQKNCANCLLFFGGKSLENRFLAVFLCAAYFFFLAVKLKMRKNAVSARVCKG